MDKLFVSQKLFKLTYIYFDELPKDLLEVVRNYKNDRKYSYRNQYLKFLYRKTKSIRLNQYDVSHLIDFSKSIPTEFIVDNTHKYCIQIVSLHPNSRIRFEIPEDIDVRKIQFYTYQKFNQFDNDYKTYQTSLFNPIRFKYDDTIYDGELINEYINPHRVMYLFTFDSDGNLSQKQSYEIMDDKIIQTIDED